MKKNKDEKRKPRRLTLSRETIYSLNEPALLELVRGGEAAVTSWCGNCTSTNDPS